MQVKYGPTLLLSNVANLKTDYIKPGQWVSDINCGIRGQYLGKTRAGTIARLYFSVMANKLEIA